MFVHFEKSLRDEGVIWERAKNRRAEVLLPPELEESQKIFREGKFKIWCRDGVRLRAHTAE